MNTVLFVNETICFSENLFLVSNCFVASPLKPISECCVTQEEHKQSDKALVMTEHDSYNEF